MVQCSDCNKWLHLRCVSLKSYQVPLEGQDWYCQKCRQCLPEDERVYFDFLPQTRLKRNAKRIYKSSTSNRHTRASQGSKRSYQGIGRKRHRKSSPSQPFTKEHIFLEKTKKSPVDVSADEGERHSKTKTKFSPSTPVRSSPRKSGGRECQSATIDEDLEEGRKLKERIINNPGDLESTAESSDLLLKTAETESLPKEDEKENSSKVD